MSDSRVLDHEVMLLAEIATELKPDKEDFEQWVG